MLTYSHAINAGAASADRSFGTRDRKGVAADSCGARPCVPVPRPPHPPPPSLIKTKVDAWQYQDEFQRMTMTCFKKVLVLTRDRPCFLPCFLPSLLEHDTGRPLRD